MVHVWQFQMGMCVICKGIFSSIASYDYELTPDQLLSDYGMEQQASIIADYYLLITYGSNAWNKRSKEKNKEKKF